MIIVEGQKRCAICGALVESDCDYYKGYYCDECLSEIRDKIDEFADAQAWWNEIDKETVYDVIIGLMMEKENGQE